MGSPESSLPGSVTGTAASSKLDLLDAALLSTPHYSLAKDSQETLPSLIRGSRGIAAFSRPYPRATIGTPTYLDFDIEKSTLTLKTEVTVQDAIDAEKAEVGTVIYLPFCPLCTRRVAAQDCLFLSVDYSRLIEHRLCGHEELDRRQCQGVEWTLGGQWPVSHLVSV